MELTIITPTKKNTYNVAWVELNTPAGNFVIARGHAPMIITLSPEKPVIYELNTGKDASETITGGIAHITRKSVTLILNS